jgi:nucleotide-binding universal stress UspA family protein
MPARRPSGQVRRSCPEGPKGSGSAVRRDRPPDPPVQDFRRCRAGLPPGDPDLDAADAADVAAPVEEAQMTSVNAAHRPILAGVDGSRSATDAVRWAAAEAHRRHTGLRLVEAIGWMPTLGEPGARHVAPTYRDVVLDGAHARLEAAAQVAGEIAPDVAVTTAVLTDYPVPRLVAESRTAQLVVVGDHGPAGGPGLLLGSVAAGIAAHAACPTVVVRGGTPPADGAVVVGIDGSPVSEAATAFAFEAAAARHAPLVAVHAWQDEMLGTSVELLVDWHAAAAEQHQLLAERLAGWGAKYPDVPVERVVVLDRPAHALRARSVGAQLVVVGSRGRGGFVGTVLGSVSRSVLHHAACPVAIVRPDAPSGPASSS